MEDPEYGEVSYGQYYGQRQTSSLESAVRWFPVTFVSTVLGWSYYVFVINLVILEMPETSIRIAYLLPYHVLFLMLVVSFITTIFTPPGATPESWKLPDQVH